MMFTWIDGHLVLAAFICPVLAWWLIGSYNARLAERHQKQHAAICAARTANEMVRWPAGTRLRVTEDLYPWHRGDVVEISRDWMRDQQIGDVAAGKGPLDYMIPLECVTDVGVA